MDPELKKYLEAMEARLRERIEQVETKLLSAFCDWARRHSIKLSLELRAVPVKASPTRGPERQRKLLGDRVRVVTASNQSNGSFSFTKKRK